VPVHLRALPWAQRNIMHASSSIGRFINNLVNQESLTSCNSYDFFYDAKENYLRTRLLIL
jgi:hypothetical protein